MINGQLMMKPFDKSFNHLMDDFFTDLPVLFKNETLVNGKKSGAVNITENEQAYSLELLAPGFDKADFKIRLEKNLLTIEAVKKEESKNETAKTIRKEFAYQSIKRSFTVDEKIDSTKIEAAYNNGVLVLTLPKKEKEAAITQEIAIK